MAKYNANREMMRRSLEVIPPEVAGEHPAIDSLRSVANMARTTACLLDDSRIYNDIADEQEYSQFLATVAYDAAKLMLTAAEDALRAMTDKGMKIE
jgi:hypothetical protein